MECLSYKGGCGLCDPDICISRCLKEELGWAINKQLWLIINTTLFKTVIPLKSKD